MASTKCSCHVNGFYGGMYRVQKGGMVTISHHDYERTIEALSNATAVVDLVKAIIVRTTDPAIDKLAREALAKLAGGK